MVLEVRVTVLSSFKCSRLDWRAIRILHHFRSMRCRCRAIKDEKEKRKLKMLMPNTAALIISYTILGVPYYNYSIMGPNTLF